MRKGRTIKVESVGMIEVKNNEKEDTRTRVSVFTLFLVYFEILTVQAYYFTITVTAFLIASSVLHTPFTSAAIATL